VQFKPQHLTPPLFVYHEFLVKLNYANVTKSLNKKSHVQVSIRTFGHFSLVQTSEIGAHLSLFIDRSAVTTRGEGAVPPQQMLVSLILLSEIGVYLSLLTTVPSLRGGRGPCPPNRCLCPLFCCQRMAFTFLYLMTAVLSLRGGGGRVSS